MKMTQYTLGKNERYNIKSIVTSALVCASAMTIGSAASAAVVVIGTETGNDVVFSYSGSLDTTGLTFLGNDAGSFVGYLGGSNGNFYSMFNGFARYSGTFASGFTTPFYTSVNSSTVGDSFGINNNRVYLPIDFASGDTLSGTLTFNNSTFASLSLTEGSYVTTIPNDTITINIESVSTVPLPAALPLLLAGLGGLGMMSRRKQG